MTPVALTYLILGLATLFWPVATVLFKRRVLAAQWLSMPALLSMSLSVIIYSTFFNTFLKGEYLLVCIFMVLSMITPALIQAFVTLLTNPRGLPIRARILILPAVIVTILMGLSVVIGGADMYRLWIQRGAEGIANRFFANSWRYNLIVAIHYYLYWFVIIAEVTYVAYYCIRHVTRFNRQLGEYYTVDRVRHADLHRGCQLHLCGHKLHLLPLQCRAAACAPDTGLSHSGHHHVPHRLLLLPPAGGR